MSVGNFDLQFSDISEIFIYDALLQMLSGCV